MGAAIPQIQKSLTQSALRLLQNSAEVRDSTPDRSQGGAVQFTQGMFGARRSFERTVLSCRFPVFLGIL